MSDHDHSITLEEWVNATCQAVVDAMRGGPEARKAVVARQIFDVEQQLPADLNDLTALLRALRALLAGQPREVASAKLDGWYAEVFGRVVEAIDEPAHEHHEHPHHPHEHPHAEPEGQRMGLGEALDEIVRDAVSTMRDGSREDRARMAQGLELLRFQAVRALEWPAFAQFLQAVQNLLRGKDVGDTDFEPPFDQAWAVISDQLSVISYQ